MDRDSSNKDKRKRVGNGTQGHSLHSYIVTQSYTQLQRNPETTSNFPAGRQVAQQELKFISITNNKPIPTTCLHYREPPGTCGSRKNLQTVETTSGMKTTSNH